jgi:hypothetical protein
VRRLRRVRNRITWVFSQAVAGGEVERGNEEGADAYGKKENIEHAIILLSDGENRAPRNIRAAPLLGSASTSSELASLARMIAALFGQFSI